MAASINASTSAGVVTTADTTGNLNLQSNGTTKLAITSTGTAVTGTNTNDSAAAGNVGEVVASYVSGVTVTTATSNLTSISLTAGDWDVAAYCSSGGIPAGCTAIIVGINTSSATIGTTGADFLWCACDTVQGVGGGALPLKQISISATTTVYFIIKTVSGTVSAAMAGTLVARRRR